MNGKFNAWLRTFVSLSMIGASVAFGTTPAAAAVTCSQRSLNVVAHEDDDLLFMNPDVQHDISAGVCVTTLFLTAGDDGQSSAYWLEREVGSQSAYGTMLGAPSTWTTSQRSFAGHSVTAATNSGGAVNLFYLRLPDGGESGTGFSATGNQSLPLLYSASISSIQAIDGSTTYSRNDLTATITAILSATGPSVVRVQDGRNGQNDHPDHQMAALFTLEALAGFTGTVKAYRGYGVVNDPANVSGNDLALKTSAVVSYANHDPLLCDPQNCPQGVAAQWTERQYTAALPWSLTPAPGPAPYSGPNVARNASVLASSQVVGQEATKAIDAVVSGYPDNAAAEWSSAGQGSGAWIQLYWSSAQTVDRVYLYDRPNGGDQVTGGLLTFSDGSSVSVPSLNNDGLATIVTFAARSVTTLRFAVTSVSATTSNVGLAELEAYNGDPGGVEPAPSVASVTPASGASGVVVTSPVTVTFSGSLNPASVTVALTGPGLTVVPGTLATTTSSATFTPTADLASNTTYTVTVNASSPAGTVMAPFTSTFTTETPTLGMAAGGFTALPPSRLLDTRLNAPKLGAGQTRSLKVTGVGGVPSANVSAVVLNVTVTETTSTGYLTVSPTGTTRPVVSNLNWSTGATIPNAVTVKVGTGGNIDLYQSGPGTAQVIVDVAGYYIDGTVTEPGGFTSITPARILDTRTTDGGGKLGATETRMLQVTGQGGVPDSNVSAVVLNVTVTETTSNGYLTVFPTGTTKPTASNLNWTTGLTIPNLVVVKVSDAGQVSLYQSGSGTAQVIADVAGYYLGGTATEPGMFVALSPARVLDTRSATAVPAVGVLTLPILNKGGLPKTGVSAVVINTTVTDTKAPGFLTVYPATSPLPTASNLNWSAAGTTIPNLVTVQLGSNGSIKFYNGSGGTTQVVADTAGYYLS